MAYDYTVLAGTQGAINHPKTDRMVELAHRWKRPVVLFAEGGGGRAGTGGKRKGGASTTKAGQGRSDETYRPLDTPTFTSFARLSGLVPIVGITSRFCFAGNAALLGCCDVIIATADSSIGMGGPALIEGGGLGVFRPEEVGPMDIQVPNGVVDIAVQDEVEAVAAAQQYLSYFQGGSTTGSAPIRDSCAGSCREPPAHLRRARSDPHPGRHRQRAGAPARVRPRHGDHPDPGRGAAGGRPSPTTRSSCPARSTATARTRAHVSCSYATPSTFPSSFSATRPA